MPPFLPFPLSVQDKMRSCPQHQMGKANTGDPALKTTWERQIKAVHKVKQDKGQLRDPQYLKNGILQMYRTSRLSENRKTINVKNTQQKHCLETVGNKKAKKI